MATWFEEVSLDYGRHHGSFVLVRGRPPLEGRRHGGGNGSGNGSNGGSTSGRPFVILGPNGAGKSTLIEAPVRALFGFRRSRKGGREAHAQREPWVGGPYRGSVRVRTAAGVVTFERDFETDRIRVTEDGKQSPLFDAEANPSRTGEAVRRYRSILRETIGLDDFDHYRETACLFQGGLLTTGLSGDLLRVAAGGHTDVESAHAELRREYGPLTVEPIGPGQSKRRKPGRIEALMEQIEEVELLVADARAVEQRRTPLVRSRDDAVARLDLLSGEIERLEVAFETLSEGHRLEVEAEAVRARIRSLENAEHRLDEALAALNLVVQRGEAHAPRYPADFPERARALEEGLWPTLARIDEEAASLRETTPGPAFPAPLRASVALAMLIILILTVLAVGVSTAAGVAILVAGLVGGGAVVARERGRRERMAARAARVDDLISRRVDVEARISRLTEDLPDGDSLTPEVLPAVRREFEREAADRRLHDEAVGAVRQALDAANQAIRLHLEGIRDRDGSAPIPDGEATVVSVPADDSPELAERARACLRLLQEAVARERDDHMAPIQLRLRDIAKARFQLPPDVEPELEAVRIARRKRLTAAAQAQAELASIEHDLAGEGRVTASALSLERELAGLRQELSAVQERAAAYRAAHSLVTDAYEAFRATDETRLLGAISTHLEQLSGGSLGPIEAGGGLDDALVRISGGRAVPLSSPPLSYGQLHATLLAVRLGAADFLAGLGVGLPLLIDDPFVHLDEGAAEDLWAVLCRISVERQVIVATQDRLVLEHLQVAPDLVLAGPVTEGTSGSGRQASSPPSSSEHLPSPRLEGEVLDLWGGEEGRTGQGGPSDPEL